MNFERDSIAGTQRVPEPAVVDRRLLLATEAGLLPVATMVIWISCAVVGVLGLVIPYPSPVAPARPPPPVQAVVMHVALTKAFTPMATVPRMPPNSLSPPRVDTPAAPPAAVAMPSPAIAFAVPIAGPVRYVPPSQAVATPIARAPVQTSLSAAGTPAQPTRLILGQGEGRQPAPEYPFEAVRQGEQGTVVVRFTVGESGDVRSAQVFVPSQYQSLNDAALRAVRDTWHFPSGPVRSYEVSIQFQLQPK